MTNEFIVDLEPEEIATLGRFLKRYGSLLPTPSADDGEDLLCSAVDIMEAGVREAARTTNPHELTGEVSVRIRLSQDQADAAAKAFKGLKMSELDLWLGDEHDSNEVLMALWKILDVIGPVEIIL